MRHHDKGSFPLTRTRPNYITHSLAILAIIYFVAIAMLVVEG